MAGIRSALLLLGTALAAFGCSGASSEAPTESHTEVPEAGCNIVQTLSANGCSNNGCHGVQHVAGVDLVSPGVAERLVGVRSVTDACQDTLLVDRDRPQDSLLLRMIDPERETPCGVPMPFGRAGVSAEDVGCFEAWVDELVASAPVTPVVNPEFDPATAESVGAKIKVLATGGALTAAELTSIRDEGVSGLRGLVNAWMATPEFERKMLDFLEVALQQRIKGPIGLQFRTRNLGPIAANLQESMVRTAWRIIQRRQPWSTIATTREWAVTTAVLAGLRYTDGAYSRRNPVFLSEAPLTPADYQDWRFIELRDAGEGEALIDFRDVDSLRGVQSRLALEIQRVGFFSAPAFLANAETNDDNQFRVTVNQTLITALGRDFGVTDTTPQAGLGGIDFEHSDPSSTCYGCHRLLDPMRLFFQREYGIFYQRAPVRPEALPSFGFQGLSAPGTDMVALGDALAQHELFPVAWTDKLCFWANSQACDKSDPEFKRIVQVFIDSNLDFLALARELLSSPLVTGVEPTLTYREKPFLVSITRQRHLCRLLDARLGTADLCRLRNIAPVLGLVPDDEFGRGRVDPVQTAVTSAFHFAGTEQLCARIANLVVAADGLVEGYAPGQPSVAIGNMVESLMGLPPNHSRHQGAVDILTSHHQAALDAGASPPESLRSTFVVACQSPDVMGLGL